MRRERLSTIIILSTSLAAVAGPLDPPAGPVAPTGKTLNEVEPRIPINAANTPGDADSIYRITASGTYYLTGPVFGDSGKAGIEIATNNVTIDLMGQQMLGFVFGVQALDAIRLTSNNAEGIIIRNGVINLWGGDGIDLRIGGAAIIEDVAAVFCGDTGIAVGNNVVVRRCVATQNLENGILFSGIGCSCEDTIANENDLDGFHANFAVSLRGCVARLNGGDGFDFDTGATVIECTAYDNDGAGFDLLSATVRNCTATFNTLDGFTVGAANVSGCTSNNNGGDGIQVSSNSILDHNLCSANTNNGVLATGNDNRIDSNNLVDNGAGLNVPGTGNFIVRNTVSGSFTSYLVDPSNSLGSLKVSPAGAGAWDNFSF